MTEVNKDSVASMNASERERAERVSALVDGELASAEAIGRQGFVASVARDEGAASRWTRYQNIGDMLRSAELSPTSRDETFMTRMRLSLAAEPVVIAPAAAPQTDEGKVGSNAGSQRLVANGVAGAGASGLRAGSTNALPLKAIALMGIAVIAGAFAWKAYSPGHAVQSAAPVELGQRDTGLGRGAVAVSATQNTANSEAGLPVGNSPELVVVQTANGAVIRDARLDQYFAAHNRVRSNGLGGGATMGASAGFVRNASIDSASHQ